MATDTQIARIIIQVSDLIFYVLKLLPEMQIVHEVQEIQNEYSEMNLLMF